MHMPLVALAPAVVLALAAVVSAAPAKTPKPEKFQQVVLNYFANLPGYRDGDIIDQSQVDAALGELKRAGVSVPQPETIVARALDPGQWLVIELRRPSGLAFMRRIAKYPGAYDRLDRLSVMPHGRETIRALVRGPDGDKMIEYLTKEKGGLEMGKMLSRTPTGTNFNHPTGRIYTVAALLAELARVLRPVTAPAGPN